VDNPNNVVPGDFDDFKETMNGWGVHMRNGCLTVAEMAAVGLGL
jgi:exosome complex RNA-binding protein Rrp4